MLNERLQRMRDFAQERKYKQFRSELTQNYMRTMRKLKLNLSQRSAFILDKMCLAEDPIVFKDEKIGFIRTISNVPQYYNDKVLKKYYWKPDGRVFEPYHNICPDYSILLLHGLEEPLHKAEEELKNVSNKEQEIFLKSVIQSICSVLNLAHRYELAAHAAGNEIISSLFARVPRFPAESFHQALQSIRFVSSIFNMINNYQLGFGRMDQYLYPLYKHDLDNKVITKDDAKELLEEFFISLNKDTDLYFGIQQGDNGQSIMLGGCKPKDGTSAVNELTYMIMEASKDLCLIDPKINLRISSETPDDLLELGCELTKCGLGFPQYSNDDVVIPALVKKGYSIEDARNYTVAACWEFIIPGKGIEIVNQGAVSLPYAVDYSFEKEMTRLRKFNDKHFRNAIKLNIKKQIKDILKKRDIHTLPSPFASIFFEGAIESKEDASLSVPYKNIGIHGAGSSNAADALASIEITYKNNGVVGLKKLLQAKHENFKNDESFRNQLFYDMPKVGNADFRVDRELKFLFDSFAEAAESFSNSKKRIRPGTGSAMYYIWLTDKNCKGSFEPKVNATADGRLDKVPFSTSLAPSQGVKVDGVLSVLKSFSVIDYSRIMNGGPITIELSPSVFKSEQGIRKLAYLVKYFVKLGDQQLQLNVLDASVLEDAIAHPEKHKNLIVRVWGWSGYFTELAPEFQQHVLNRHKYNL